MTSDENPFDFVRKDPSLQNQLAKTMLAAVGGFIVETLIKAAYDRFVVERRNARFDEDT